MAWGVLASACLWIALVLVGAVCIGLLALGECSGLVLRRLRLPERLLRPIRRWLRSQGLLIQLEALGVDALWIGWSTKGRLILGLRGIRVGLAASCRGLDSDGEPPVGDSLPAGRSGPARKQHRTAIHVPGTS
jgi:hypothetical protein